MKLFLNIILILLTLFSCYIEDIYLLIRPPKPEKTLFLTIRAQHAFNFDQEKALGDKRKMALSQYIPLYTYISSRLDSAEKKWQKLADKIVSFQPHKQKGEEELAKYLKKEFGLEIPQKTVHKLLNYPNLQNLIEGMLTIEESILRNKILEDSELFMRNQTIEVLYPDPEGTVAHSAEELITLEEARLSLQRKANQLFWQVEKPVLDSAIQIALATLQSNLKYDQKENDRRIEEIIRRYPSKVIPYRAGAVLVPFRKVLNEEDVLLLAAYKEAETKDIYASLPKIGFAVVFSVLFYNLLLSKALATGFRKKPPYRLFLSLLIITIFFLKACLLLTPFPVYVIPFCLLPLLLLLLNRDIAFASWTTLVAAVLVSLFTGRTLEIMLFFAFGGMAAVLTASGMRKRAHILFPSLAVGIVNMAFIFILSLDWETAIQTAGELRKIEIFSLDGTGIPMASGITWAFIGGFLGGPSALLLLPFLEISWHTASTFKLNRYIDLQNPLMVDLLTKAPGTYQHTMTVAYLAQAVGSAVGANTILLRIGAYYHDVGKLLKPKFFVENQFDGKNSHDELNPIESADVIVGHVRDGKTIAQRAGIPEIVIDLIEQHHGTLLIEYFHDKALESNPGIEPQEEDFRYPGPKPQSVEAAILMIVDAVEAASRSIEKPTREKSEAVVRHIIEDRLADGQFEECSLTTRDIAVIIRTLVDSLEASFHGRVEYPWQKKEKEALKTEL